MIAGLLKLTGFPYTVLLETSAQGLRYPAGVHDIGAGVTAWMTPNGGWGQSNSVLVTGKDASLLVDTLWDLPRTAEMLEAFRPRVEGAPIRQLVNTHADGDHWFGNELVEADEIIATKSAARRMRSHGPREMKLLHTAARAYHILGRLPIPRRRKLLAAADYIDHMTASYRFFEVHPVYPTATFSSKLVLHVGGRRVELIEVGPAHTRGDLVAWLTDDRILCAGDVVFNGVTPVLWDGSSGNWIRALDRILQLKPEVVVPGHGPVTDGSGVEAMRRYWVFLRTATRRHYERGRPPLEAATRIVESEDYQKQPFTSWESPERIVINIYAIYQRLLHRGHRMSTLKRLRVMRETAFMAQRMATMKPGQSPL